MKINIGVLSGVALALYFAGVPWSQVVMLLKVVLCMVLIVGGVVVATSPKNWRKG